MKFLYLFFLLLCLVEIYGQRSRTSNTNQDVSTQEPKTVRGRGRTRFTVAQEVPQTPERPSSNRRASTRTRIHSNNPKAVADRRARPTEAPRGYAVEEINNDSPIDSFRRQSKPRILTESRFEIPTITVARRQQNFEASRPSPSPPASDEFPVEELGFGSTARAILQARGETLLPKTTTPVIDEAFLLNNFGSTIRSIAASRNEVPIQRATPLRSEVPILDREDIPSRRSSLRGDPLPSLKGSDVGLDRQPSIRGRKKGKAKLAEARANSRLESLELKKNTEQIPVDEIPRLDPEPDAPESVQGIFEQSELITETQLFETSSETFLSEDDDLRKTSSAEVVTQRVTEPPAPRKTVVNSRRNGGRGRGDSAVEFQPNTASKTRASRTRVSPRHEEVNTVSSTRTRGSRRRYDDAVAAESRTRGPSVFTAEQYQEVTSRSRTGRRIDSRFENVPERITVDLTPVTTIRARTPGRRATTTGLPTERFSGRDRSSSRGRSRSRASPEETTFAPVSRSTNTRRPSSIEDTAFYGDKTSNKADLIETAGRRETNSRFDSIEPKAAINRGHSAATTSNRRTASRSDSVKSRSNDRASVVDSRRETSSKFELPEQDSVNSRSNGRASITDSRRESTSRLELPESRNTASSRNSGYRQNNPPDETLSFGDKSSRTRANSPQTTTIEESTTIPNTRSKNRFPEIPPEIDEAKLEVLPLFASEVKTVPSARSRGHRSRSSVNRRQSPSQDHMHVSATENDVKFVEKPTTSAFTRVTVTRTESIEASTSRTRLSTRLATSTASTTTTETSTRPSSTTVTTTKVPDTTSVTTKKWVTRLPPVIRESVVAEINQVTSKSTITRRKKVSKAKAAEMLSRGVKKSEVNLADVGKKTSAEEINEEDNYPEPFKTLIQSKKKQEESRPAPSSARGETVPIKGTSTEKAFVTSSTLPRGSSVSRIVTTDLPSTGRRSQLVNEIVNDNENELDPKPTITSTTQQPPTTRSARLRLLPKFSEKPKYTQKSRDKPVKSITEKPKYSPEKVATKTTFTPRKTYSPKSYSTRGSLEHHSRRKALRSTASPPSTTPLNFVTREARFSAKFIRKETADNPEKNSKNSVNQQPKGLYSSRKASEKETREEKEKTGRKLDVSVTQTPKPSLPIKKFNSSRYSSRYRGDASQRSTILKSSTTAPFYIPTIPTPAYVPTIPTIAPSFTPDYMVWSDHRPFDYTWYNVK